MKCKPGLKSRLLVTSLLILAVCSFSFFTLVQPDNEAKALDVESDLPLVGSMANLQSLLKQADGSYYMTGRNMFAADGMPQMEMTKNDSAAAPTAANDSSATNVQVAGVDEADIIKTDRNYIFQVSGQKLTIVKAFPAADMQVVNRFTFEDPNFWASDIYVDNNYLIVMGRSHFSLPVPYPLPQPLPKIKAEISRPMLDAELSLPMLEPDIYPPYYPANMQTSKVIVYDIKDKANIKKVREVELEGSVVSTRKIGSSVYVVANRNINWYRAAEGNPEIPLPAYKDSQLGDSLNQITVDKIRYFPDAIYPSYILVAALNLDELNAPLDIKTYLGNGENIYASLDNLYVAVSSYNYEFLPQNRSGVSTSATSIYKFALKQGVTNYAGKGSVPGTILNQFSMDEYGSYFRIATTSSGSGTDGIYTSQNNVYVLNSNMEISGRLENIAPGERIFSTRFMGDRVYMVTFRNVDPFFVIDLKNPASPQILGQLKIPGYSDYLHPYDENHVIGFGKDTVELKGYNGQPQAYYQGMKLAIFDVTDVTNPQEIAKELIGDRGTDSELLNNHKALLFAKDKNLLAFPVTLMEVAPNYNEPGSERAKLEYGHFAFQGAYIYNIDLANGFRLKGRITHLNSEDYLKAGDYWYNSDKNISRIMYIGNTIYTISPTIVMAHNLADLSHVKTISLR